MDVVVTVPKTFTHPCAPGLRGLAAWIAEGDAAGDPWSGVDWEFTVGGFKPVCEPGDRVYVVCEDALRGYAPLIRLEQEGDFRWLLVRGGDARAVTLREPIKGFRGWRRRWWNREVELPFPDWKTAKLVRGGILVTEERTESATCQGRK